MSQASVSITLSHRKIEESRHIESGRLTITTPDSGIDGLPTIVERQVTGARLVFRSFATKQGKGVTVYEIRLAGRRNLSLSDLVGAIRSYLQGDSTALSKINEQ